MTVEVGTRPVQVVFHASLSSQCGRLATWQQLKKLTEMYVGVNLPQSVEVNPGEREKGGGGGEKGGGEKEREGWWEREREGGRKREKERKLENVNT